MKTFTATHLNKHAQEVFAAAKEDGGVYIKHDRYPGVQFMLSLTAIPRDDPYKFDSLTSEQKAIMNKSALDLTSSVNENNFVESIHDIEGLCD